MILQSKRKMIITMVAIFALICGLIFFNRYYKEKDITKLFVGDWKDNNGIISEFYKDRTMKYFDSSVDVHGEYEFLDNSIMKWTLHRIYIPNDIIYWKYEVVNEDEIKIEEMKYNENKELVSYNNPVLILTRIK